MNFIVSCKGNPLCAVRENNGMGFTPTQWLGFLRRIHLNGRIHRVGDVAGSENYSQCIFLPSSLAIQSQSVAGQRDHSE